MKFKEQKGIRMGSQLGQKEGKGADAVEPV